MHIEILPFQYPLKVNWKTKVYLPLFDRIDCSRIGDFPVEKWVRFYIRGCICNISGIEPVIQPKQK